jgi:signal transduction histidine kinase
MMTRKLEHVRNRAKTNPVRATGAMHGSRARVARGVRREDEAETVAELERTVTTQAEELKRTKARLDEEVDRRRRLELRFLEICERERRRFGQDLHDDTCQTLAGLAWIAAKAGNDTMKRDPESARLFSAIAQELNDALEQTYRIAQGLHPAVLKEHGFAGALACLADRAAERVPCVLEVPTGLSLPDATELALFRIAQEALMNAVKHSGAGKIAIRVFVAADNLILTIEDDGHGLESSMQAKRGMGRDIMEYRARAIGGELNVVSHKGRGTLVQCVVPSERR